VEVAPSDAPALDDPSDGSEELPDPELPPDSELEVPVEPEFVPVAGSGAAFAPPPLRGSVAEVVPEACVCALTFET
jgi:hypothetical protein